MADKYFYDYDAPRAYCEQVGVTFVEEWVAAVDEVFYQLGFAQDTVDELMRQYIWRVKHLFDPANYSIVGRIVVAGSFLVGVHPATVSRWVSRLTSRDAKAGK